MKKGLETNKIAFILSAGMQADYYKGLINSYKTQKEKVSYQISFYQCGQNEEVEAVSGIEKLSLDTSKDELASYSKIVFVSPSTQINSINFTSFLQLVEQQEEKQVLFLEEKEKHVQFFNYAENADLVVVKADLGAYIVNVLQGEINNFINVCKIISESGFSINFKLFDFKKTSLQQSLFNIGSRIGFWLKWNTTLPISEFKAKEIFPNKFGERSINRLLFLGVAIVLLMVMSGLSVHTSTSGDEDKHVEQAEKVFNYFETEGADTSYNYSKWGPFYAYNISYDVLLHVCIDTFEIENVYEFRHLVNSWVGWLAILFAGLLASLIGGRRVGVITMLLLFITPSFLGHSYNNPKDIPFAFTYILTVYFIFRMIKEYPRPTIKMGLLIALAIGACLNIRIGGLILFGYLFGFLGLKVLGMHGFKGLFAKTNITRVLILIAFLVVVSIISYWLGYVFWPFGKKDPINNPLKSLEIMTNFTVSIRQIFEGEFVWSDKIPWYYPLKYLFITTPIVILLGGILFPIISYLKKKEKKYDRYLLFIVVFSFVFPFFYVIWKESNVYGGIRHMLFAYQFIVIWSAIGLVELVKYFKKNFIQWTVAGVLVVMGLLPLIHIVRNHPVEYVYYNEITGGVKGAFGQFETDYYYNSHRSAVDWLVKEKLDDFIAKHDTAIIAINFEPKVTNYFLKDYDKHHKVRSFYYRYYDRSKYDWDYAIAVNSYVSPTQLQKGTWPPPNTIHTIDVSGMPVCAILERKTKKDYEAFEAMNANDFAKAVSLFQEAKKEDPGNASILLGLSESLFKMGRFQESLGIVENELLKVYPDYDKGMYQQALCYKYLRNNTQAKRILGKITKLNYKYSNAYFMLGVIASEENQWEQSLIQFSKTLSVNANVSQAYSAITQLITMRNDATNHQVAFQLVNSQLRETKPKTREAIFSNIIGSLKNSKLEAAANKFITEYHKAYPREEEEE